MNWNYNAIEPVSNRESNCKQSVAHSFESKRAPESTYFRQVPKMPFLGISDQVFSRDKRSVNEIEEIEEQENSDLVFHR